MKRQSQELYLYFAWVIALVGCCLSVFYGEILGHKPCSLCWYQRMALFPLAVLLGVAAYRSDTSITPYALPFTAVGAFVALYQVAGPYWFGGEHICIFKEDCASDVISFFGVINFPMLSALGFILVFLLLWRGSSRNTFTAS